MALSGSSHWNRKPDLFTRIVCPISLTWNIDSSLAYHGGMKIIGTLETIETATFEEISSDCSEYQRGFDAMSRMLPEGVRLLNVRVDR